MSFWELNRKPEPRWNEGVKPSRYDRLFGLFILPLCPAWFKPNHFTMLRMLFVPALVALAVLDFNVAALLLFAFLALTDHFDGALARARREVTEWGIVFDALADRLLIGAALAVVVVKHGVWAAGLALLAAEVAVAFVSWRQIRSGVIVPSKAWGKAKMVMEVAGVMIFMLGVDHLSAPLSVFANAVLLAAAAAAVMSIRKTVLEALAVPTFRVAAYVAFAAASLFLLYSFLPLSGSGYFTSPDEAANFFFARTFADEGVLYHFDPWNIFAEGAVHPRSMTVVDDFVVPVGFVGLPIILGTAAKAVGAWAIPFLTPFLAVLGVAGWGLLVSRLYWRRVGVVAAFLLAFHPVWWYESARTLQPNVAFLALVVWGAYFLVHAPCRLISSKASAADGDGEGEGAAPVSAAARRPSCFLRVADGLVGGALFGLALAVRPAEAYWLALAAAVGAAFFLRRLPLSRLVFAALAAAAVLAPFLVINQSLYGSPFAAGYGSVGAVKTGETLGGFGMRLLGPLQPYLFPLGFAPRTALTNFFSYGLGFLSWWTGVVAIAAIFLWRRFRPTRRDLTVIAVTLAVAAWLVLFYGSWTIRDSTLAGPTIGSSYFRYWLPLFMFSTLPVALAAVSLAKGRPRLKRWLFLVAALYVAVSSATVFLSRGEGLLAVRAETWRYAPLLAELKAVTPEGAVIVTDRSDKFLFPDRSVMVGLGDEGTIAALGKLAGRAPLYHFGTTLPECDMRWLNDERLPTVGLRIVPERAFGEETLYRIEPTKP